MKKVLIISNYDNFAINLKYLKIKIMILLFIGIALVIFSVQFINRFYQLMPYKSIFNIIGVALIIFGIATSMVKQIGAGELGVQALFGKVDNRILVSGLNIINPLVEVKTFDAKTQNYTMSSVRDEGDVAGDDAIRVLTADGLEVVIDLTVLYRIIPNQAPKILSEIGTDYKNVVVRPITRTKIRDNAVYYDAVSLYSKKRDEFQAKIFASIEKDFKQRGLILEQLLVRNISLPASVKASIESKINAEQDAQKMEFVLQKEKQEAERKRVEAQGIADYQKILSTGLSDKQLQYEMIKANKEIATSPNAKVIIMGNGKSVPIILNDK
jgi:regulator of protease activity HflC (stomatin/prohibitin superfamily)